MYKLSPHFAVPFLPLDSVSNLIVKNTPLHCSANLIQSNEFFNVLFSEACRCIAFHTFPGGVTWVPSVESEILITNCGGACGISSVQCGRLAIFHSIFSCID